MYSVWTQDSPVGPLTITVTSDGVRKVEFESERQGRNTLKLASGGPAPEVVEAFENYFAGDPEPLDELKIDYSLTKGPRYRQVLKLLRSDTGFGQTVTYGQLAEAAEIPGAAQLVGQIMGSNPTPIIVPCHRVVAADGSLGGFSGGLDNKRILFRIEAISPRGGGWAKQDPDQTTLF